MTIYSDNAGNHFLGDSIYANHNVGYLSVNFLQGESLTTLSADLNALFTNAGLLFRNVVPQANIDTWLNGGNLQNSLIHFGSVGDINDRYGFSAAWGGNNTGSGGPVTLFNNNGSTNTTNAVNESTNLLARAEYPSSSSYGVNGGMSQLNWIQPSEANAIDYSPITVVAVADSYSVSLFFTQKRLITGTGDGNISWFVHAGLLADINTNFTYYNATKFNSSFIMAGGLNSFTVSGLPILNGRHYISSTSKYPLETGDAQYAIVCSDGQTPTAQWATDMYVFDNNATLGYPAIGRVRNLLLAQGSYTIGKPVKIQGSAMPDAGFNRWLPVGTFAGKTVLMRCYSSVNI